MYDPLQRLRISRDDVLYAVQYRSNSEFFLFPEIDEQLLAGKLT